MYIQGELSKHLPRIDYLRLRVHLLQPKKASNTIRKTPRFCGINLKFVNGSEWLPFIHIRNIIAFFDLDVNDYFHLGCNFTVLKSGYRLSL